MGLGGGQIKQKSLSLSRGCPEQRTTLVPNLHRASAKSEAKTAEGNFRRLREQFTSEWTSWTPLPCDE